MAQKTLIKFGGATNTVAPSKIMLSILEELRLLRREVMLLFPQEDLEEYAHPDRIEKAYQKALAKYPLSRYGDN